MGVGKMGKLPILLPEQPVHQFPREKANLGGEKVTLEKKGLGVTCILRVHGTQVAVVSVLSVRKDGR